MRRVRITGGRRSFVNSRSSIGQEEIQRIESVLATARAFLAICALIAIYIDPTEPSRFAPLAYGLLVVYVGHSATILVLLRTASLHPSRPLSFILHAVDVLWATSLTLFTEGPNSPFFVFFVLVLFAAAYRWGFRETVMTAGMAVALLFIEAVVIARLPGLFGEEWVEGELHVHRLILRGAYLLVAGVLLGYLAEREKLQRAEISAIARTMARAHTENTLSGTMHAVFDEVLGTFAADRLLLAISETTTGRSFLWQADRASGSERTALHSFELDADQLQTYLFPMPARSWLLARNPYRRSRTLDLLGLDSEGRRLHGLNWRPPDGLLAAHVFEALLCTSVDFQEEWAGRVFLYNPALDPEREAGVRFFHTLVRQVAPAVFNVHLVSRLRSRAGALERSRVARELHDGVVQSLIGVEMRVDVLRRLASGMSTSLAVEELARIQDLLRNEILALRELMQQMKPLDIGPRQLLDFVADLVDRFGRDTGISAKFVPEFDELPLPPRVCRQLAGIVQEALANVRKHSGARNVLVRFDSCNGNWRVVIDDDGRGFDFCGRLSHVQLDSARQGPVAIKERVRTIGGTLLIESTPGQGARLEIELPQRRDAQ